MNTTRAPATALESRYFARLGQSVVLCAPSGAAHASNSHRQFIMVSSPLNDLVLTSKLVADTSGRLEKIALLAALLKRLAPNEIPIATGFLIGWPRQGKLGVGWASVAEARRGGAPTAPGLPLAGVGPFFPALKNARGKRAGADGQRIPPGLLAGGTADEQSFLT